MHLMAVDSDRWACETYRANFPGVDVRQAMVADVLDNLPACDVLLGGPPCQSFSLAGDGLGEDDERNAWPDMIAAVAKVRPRMFLAENVPGMLTQRHRAYTASVLADLERLGYRVEVRLLDAVAYGVPQFRRRVWWWGIRADVDARHQWPAPTHQWPRPEAGGMFGGAQLKPAVTVGQALGINNALRRLSGPNSPQASVPDYQPTQPCPTAMAPTGGKAGLCVVGRYQAHGNRKSGDVDMDAPGPTMRSGTLPGCSDIELVEYRPNGVLEVEDTLAAPADTISGGGTATGGAEPVAHAARQGYVRRLTPAECARLQSCPDDMAWPAGISKTAQYRILGNGWPCGMAAALSRALHAADPTSETVVSLFCGGGLGDLGWTGRYWTLEEETR